MATTNPSLAPSPKDRRHAATDPIKEAASPIPAQPSRAAAAGTNTTAHDDIALRAYQYWRERGCPEGSPDADWYRAEGELRPSRNS